MQCGRGRELTVRGGGWCGVPALDGRQGPHSARNETWKMRRILLEFAVRPLASLQPSHRTAGVGTGAGNMGTCPPWGNSDPAALDIHIKVSIKLQYSPSSCKCELLTTWWCPVRRCTVQWARVATGGVSLLPLGSELQTINQRCFSSDTADTHTNIYPALP